MTDDTDPTTRASHDGADADADLAADKAPGGATEKRPAATVLTALEARILGVLIEKQLTVPDTYPLSLNALKAGCNQKNNRDPVISVSESEIAAALDDLRARSLIIESSGSRTLRYEQNLRRVLDIPGAAVPLLAVLMLRGPQTAAELRLNTERMQRFADASSVEGFLHELAGHASGPLVVELPRRPGERERRWMHRLVPDDARLASAGGQDDPGTFPSTAASGGGSGGARSLQAGPGPDGGRIADLEARVETLEARIQQLQQVLDEVLEHVERPKQRWG